MKKKETKNKRVMVSGVTTEHLRIVCETLGITPAEAVSLALKDKAHALTCNRSHQQSEPSRH